MQFSALVKVKQQLI